MRDITLKTEQKIKKIQQADLEKMKAQFARDLKNMIDAEVKKHQQETSKKNKMIEKATRMVKLEMENQALEEATKHAQKVETTKKLANMNPNQQKDFQASLRSQTGLGATGDLSSTRTFVSKLTSINVLGEGKPSLKT